MNEERIARGLGWFSIGIGIAEIIAPKRLASSLAMKPRTTLLRLYGVREIATGVGILSPGKKAPWLWARVAGDFLDLATLATAPARGKKGRTAAIAVASVVGVTVLDIICGKRFAEREGLAGESKPAQVRHATGEWEPTEALQPRQPTLPVSPPPATAAREAKYGYGNLLDINEATRNELLSIQGLSRTGAEAIIRYRERHGRFRMMYELERLPQLTVDEFIILRDVVQIVAATEEEETHRLEKPDLTTEPGGRGM